MPGVSRAGADVRVHDEVVLDSTGPRLGKISFLTLDRQQRDLAKSLGFLV